jgi:S1-C subfamily serine protease
VLAGCQTQSTNSAGGATTPEPPGTRLKLTADGLLVGDFDPKLTCDTELEEWRGSIGVAVSDLRPSVARAVGLDEVEGAFVEGFARSFRLSPRRAGLKLGDVILSVEGHAIRDRIDLMDMIYKCPAATVDIEVWRNGARQTVRMKVDAERLDGDQRSVGLPSRVDFDRMFGWHAAPFGLYVRKFGPETTEGGGVPINRVLYRGPRFDLLKEGDKIIGINGQAVETLYDIKRLAERAARDGNPTFTMTVRRGDEDIRVEDLLTILFPISIPRVALT